jgi:hypothetical protein
MTHDNLKTYKNSLKIYLGILDRLNSLNINLGCEFQWGDTLTGEFKSSDNFYFEYYNVMFNLAISYHNLGLFMMDSKDDDKLKDSLKNFEYAAFNIDRLIKDIPIVLKANELSKDMSRPYLNFVNIY